MKQFVRLLPPTLCRLNPSVLQTVSSVDLGPEHTGYFVFPHTEKAVHVGQRLSSLDFRCPRLIDPVDEIA